MFSPCLPLFAFGNANFPSSPPWVGWVLWYQHPLLPSVTPPVAPLGQTLPTMKFLGVTESRVWPGKAAFTGRHEGWGRTRGAALGAEPCTVHPGGQGSPSGLGCAELGVGNCPSWLHCKNDWEKTQVDQDLEKSADCSREIIESMWTVT